MISSSIDRYSLFTIYVLDSMRWLVVINKSRAHFGDNNMASKDEVVSAIAALLEGERIKGYDRWLRSYALVNFVDEDLTAVIPTKTLIQRDA